MLVCLGNMSFDAISGVSLNPLGKSVMPLFKRTGMALLYFE